MALTKEDKDTLLKWGYPDTDFPQIERAIKVATYTVWDENKPVKKQLTKQQAIRVLGRREWLSGIGRAAFHWNSCRQAKQGTLIHIDCRKLFV